MRNRVLPIAATVVAVVVGLGACSIWSSAEDQLKTTQTNLANQRKAAVAFLKFQPAVQQLRFTREGVILGSGSWAVNAVVTIDGKEYREILGVKEHSGSGEPLPSPPPGSASAPATVIYSDGTSELMK